MFVILQQSVFKRQCLWTREKQLRVQSKVLNLCSL